MIENRRHVIAGVAAIAGLAALPRPAAAARIFRPEDFGAKGDGVTDDTFALNRLSAAVNAAGGGTVVFARKVYRVGRQRQTYGREGYAFDPSPLMEFVNLGSDLDIQGNGATLRCTPGLRYGTFDGRTGRRTDRAMPNLSGDELATPYTYMIRIAGCRGLVAVSDMELDGGLARLLIGGRYGDVGWQISCTGLALVENRGPERIVRVHSHHHAQDGVMIDGLDGARAPGVVSVLTGVLAEHNGRQGLSFVGGRGYRFEKCGFNHTGSGQVASAPGAGVDIEAEAGKKVRDLQFTDCAFVGNVGCGVVADSGDSADARFTRCRFVGSRNWAAWPNKPGFRFESCRFVGPIVRAWGDADPARACRFTDCEFRDDPALSVGGKVYGGENRDRPIADLPGNRNVLFDRCRFRLTHDSVLPWSIDVTYLSCTLSQVSKRQSYPRGIYRGENSIVGNVGMYSARNYGRLIVNGTPYPVSKPG